MSNILNSFGTDTTNLNNSIIQNKNQINNRETGLSTLYNLDQIILMQLLD